MAKSDGLTGNKRKVVDFLGGYDRAVMTQEVADGIDRGRGYVLRMLEELEEAGIVKKYTSTFSARKLYSWELVG